MKKFVLLILILLCFKCNPLEESNPLLNSYFSEIQGTANHSVLIDILQSTESDQIDFNFQYLIASGPRDIYLQFVNLISNPKIQNVSDLNSLYDNFQDGDLENLYLNILDDFESNLLLSFELLKFRSYLNKEISIDDLNWLKSIKFKSLSKVELYAYLRTLEFIVRTTIRTDINLGYSMLSYSLYILESLNISNDYPSFKADVYYDLYLIKSAQSNNDTLLKNQFYNKAFNLYDSLGLSSKKYKCNWSYHLYDPKNKPIKSVAEIEELNLSIRDKVIISTDLGIGFLTSNPSKSLEYFKYSDRKLVDQSCFFYKHIINNLLGYTNYQILNFDLSKEYFDKSWDLKGCSKIVKWDTEFYNITVQKEILQKSGNQKDVQKGIDFRLRQRELAILKKMSLDHLEDFYAMNTVEILSLVNELEVLNIDKFHDVFSLVNDTKSKELKRQRREDEIIESDNYNSEIKGLLREVNNFNNIEDFENPAYKKLFHLLIDQYIANSNKIEVEFPEIDFSPILNQSNEYQLVEFLTWDEVYAVYSYTENGMELAQLDRNSIDNNISILLEKIKNNENLDSIKQALKTQLFEELKLDDKTPITLLPDGPLVNLPFHLLFDQPVRQHLSVEELITESKSTINKNNISLLSYTDDETLSSSASYQYDELIEAYNECIAVNQAVGGDAMLLPGAKATKENFTHAMKSDLFHIASHGATNMSNRYDNYILLRDNKAAPVKMYSYEIEELEHCPKLVVLSACDTGIGAFSNGVGTYSISRAFMAAGAETIIKSLWKVNDRSTKIFMTKLYSHWAQGISLMEALSKTRNEMDADPNFSPFDWAGFVLEGNGDFYLE